MRDFQNIVLKFLYWEDAGLVIGVAGCAILLAVIKGLKELG